MQSKQVAVAGILTGAVVAGLGMVVLLGGLAEAERPDHDPVTGYEDVGNGVPTDVDPLPPLPASKLSEKPSAGASSRLGRGAAGDRDGEAYEPGEPDPTAADDTDRPKASSEPTETGGAGDSTPTSGPTGTPEPEPTTEPTETAEPTTDPTPTETATPTTEPQTLVQIDY